MGLSVEYARPEWMILTVLPVPPPPVRPSISVDGGTMRSEDDLTFKLGDVLKASASVRKCEQEGAPPHVITEYEQLLQVRPPQTWTSGSRTSLTSHWPVSCRYVYG
jgi:DNA-directed RNA polymerase II subunit RPB1